MEAEHDSIDVLARRYAHRVPFFVRKVSRSFNLGYCWHDDLISAGYWGLFKALQNIRRGAPERERSAYVSQRVIGAVLDEARKRLRSSRGLLSSETTPDEGQWINPFARTPQTPEDDTAAQRRKARVARALELLHPDQQRLLWSYMAGASVREIALTEGVPVGTMRTRFSRLGRDLRGKAPHLRRVLLDLEGPETI